MMHTAYRLTGKKFMMPLVISQHLVVPLVLEDTNQKEIHYFQNLCQLKSKLTNKL